jgi:hypothetical protein
MTQRKKIVAALWMAFFGAQLYAQTISGTVVDALSKTPIDSVKITVVELKKDYAPDSLGAYKIEGLTKGSYSVRFEAPQYVKQSKTVKIIDAKGQTGSITMSLNVLLFSLSTNVDQAQGKQEIKYFFPGHTDVVIDVCDSSGKTVRTVFDRTRIGGTRIFRWNGMDNWGKMLPAGKYTCKFKSGNLFTCRTLLWQGAEKK